MGWVERCAKVKDAFLLDSFFGSLEYIHVEGGGLLEGIAILNKPCGETAMKRVKKNVQVRSVPWYILLHACLMTRVVAQLHH